MTHDQLIRDYEAGPQLLRNAVAGLSREQLLARPIPGKWSVMEVVSHIGDFDPIYAGRIRWVLAHDRPSLPGGDPDLFASALHYQERDLDEELAAIEAVRRSTARILKTLSPAEFDRVGVHSEDGELSLATLVQRVTGHIPHHVKFLMEKRQALRV